MNMRKSIDIPNDDPFKNDKFERKAFINNLMKIISKSKYDESLVISLDSAWGTGKSTFLKMWEAYINNQESNYNDYTCIYFNSWENDDGDEPLLPMLNLISEKAKGTTNFKHTKLFEFGTQIIGTAVPFALKILTNGILDISNIKVDEFTEGQVKDFSGEIGKAYLENYNKSNNLKLDFRKALSEYQNDIDKKIIFFIDELDRCRPLYAIKVLERIKHFFEVDGFIFIFALDKEQLAHSISTIYGQNMNSDGYLRRFFDLELCLPEPDLNQYIDVLIEEYKLSFNNIDYFWNLLKTIVVENNFSLRDVDKLFINLNIILPLINFRNSYVNKIIISNIYSYFISLKIIDSHLFNKIITRNYMISDIDSLKSTIKLNFKSLVDFEYEPDECEAVYFQSIEKFLDLILDRQAMNLIYNENKWIVKFTSLYAGEFNLVNLCRRNKCEIIDVLTFSLSVDKKIKK